MTRLDFLTIHTLLTGKHYATGPGLQPNNFSFGSVVTRIEFYDRLFLSYAYIWHVCANYDLSLPWCLRRLNGYYAFSTHSCMWVGLVGMWFNFSRFLWSSLAECSTKALPNALALPNFFPINNGLIPSFSTLCLFFLRPPIASLSSLLPLQPFPDLPRPLQARPNP